MPKGTKRRRYVPAGPKRPIDKILKNVTTLASSDNRVVTLMTATFPGTVVGLRWEGGLTSTSTGNTDSMNQVMWAIVVVPDGTAVSDLAFSASNAAGNTYQPEQNVLATGVCGISFEMGFTPCEGSTKTMRKLKAGDAVVLLTQSLLSTNNFSWSAQIQFFYKT